MKVLIDYNDWKKVEDVPQECIRSGVIEMALLPPLLGLPYRQTAEGVNRYSDLRVIVYATGRYNENGLPIFSNRP